MPAFIDLTGRRFGRLVVIARATKPGEGHVRWRCICDCGTLCTAAGRDLRWDDTKSCGCWYVDTRRTGARTHGRARTSIYATWQAMKDRCTNPNNDFYDDYGGRGIRVCDRWLQSFEAFLEDVGERPSPKHQLDRFPDNDGNYEPGNVRWATGSDNCRNRRSSVFLEFGGRRLSLSDWADIIGMPRKALQQRVRTGWSAARALTEPLLPGRRPKQRQG